MDGIYLDYNATTPIDPAVAEAMLPYVHGLFGNPSSGHSFGLAARQGVDRARQQVAGMLGCSEDDLIFTSGGTEANNHAIKGVAEAYRHRGNHIITSAVEHPAVTEVCRYLETHGVRTTYLPVDEHGMVDPGQVEEAITPQTVLVTIMHANNEVGTIQPIAEIAGIAHRHGVLVHSDCAQSIGKIPVKADDLGVDLLSVAGHKLYAPKGIGALYIRPGVQLEKLMHGANHEGNRRAGTENIILMAGLGQASELIERNLGSYAPTWPPCATVWSRAFWHQATTPASTATRPRGCPTRRASAFAGWKPTASWPTCPPWPPPPAPPATATGSSCPTSLRRCACPPSTPWAPFA